MDKREERRLDCHFAWHLKQWQHLTELRIAGRLPHALLLAGPPGIGKMRFAEALSYSLLCDQSGQETACGDCKQCQLCLSGHPDLKIIEPEEGARQIKVDQIRAVIHFLSQTSHAGGYKIVLLKPAETMNINAANAVLKSLEEPTENSLLILVSDMPGSLMPTIRSRCQLLYFPVPAANDVLAWLTPFTANEGLASQLLLEAAGQPLTALNYLNSGGLQRRQLMTTEFLQAMSGRLQPLALADKWKEHELADILSWLNAKLSLLIRSDQANLKLPAEWANLAPISSVLLLGLLDKTNDLALKLRRGANPNKQLALEALLLSCVKVFQLGDSLAAS